MCVKKKCCGGSNLGELWWEGRWVDGAHSRERARAHWTIPETYPGPGIFSFSHYKFSLNLSNILNFYSFKYLIVFKTWKQIIKTLILQHINCNLNICWILQWKKSRAQISKTTNPWEFDAATKTQYNKDNNWFISMSCKNYLHKGIYFTLNFCCFKANF